MSARKKPQTAEQIRARLAEINRPEVFRPPAPITEADIVHAENNAYAKVRGLELMPDRKERDLVDDGLTRIRSLQKLGLWLRANPELAAEHRRLSAELAELKAAGRDLARARKEHPDT